MKYYRFILRAEDRINGSAWATPEYNLGIPYTKDPQNTTVKIVLESAYINQHDNSGNTINDHMVEVQITQPTPLNVYDTTGGYSIDGHLAFIPQIERETNQSIFVHYLNTNSSDVINQYNEYRLLDFNNKNFKLRLSRLGTDASLITIPSGTGSAETQLYRITLGIYVDE